MKTVAYLLPYIECFVLSVTVAVLSSAEICRCVLQSFTVIVHNVVKSSCEPDDVDIECPLPSVHQLTDAADIVTDDSIDLEWKHDIERRISLYAFIVFFPLVH